MLHFALRRSDNIHWQALDVDKAARAAQKRQRPCIVWLTGVSGAGKSTIANLVERRLYSLGFHTYLLDGDNVRHGLCKDLGFTAADRVENVRRVGEVASLMLDAGLIVLCSFISPFAAERRSVPRAWSTRASSSRCTSTPRSAWPSSATPRASTARPGRRAAELHRRRLALRAARAPELHLDADVLAPEQSAQQIIDMLAAAGVLGS